MSIAAARATLVQDLSLADIRVYDGWQDKIESPCAVVVPSRDQYAVPGKTFGIEVEVRMDIILMVASSLAELDDLIETTLLNSMGDWGFIGVDGPGGVGGLGFTTVDVGQNMLGARVHLSKMITLGG